MVYCVVQNQYSSSSNPLLSDVMEVSIITGGTPPPDEDEDPGPGPNPKNDTEDNAKVLVFSLISLLAILL